jgi:hypothetical protein
VLRIGPKATAKEAREERRKRREEKRRAREEEIITEEQEEQRRAVDAVEKLTEVAEGIAMTTGENVCESPVNCMPESQWERLPDELKIMVLGGFSLLELLRQSKVSLNWGRLAEDESLWRNLYQRIAVQTLGAPVIDRQDPRMPRWRQQLLAYMGMKDFLITAPKTRDILQYLPMRSASLPAIIIKLGPTIEDDRVLLYRPEMIMTLFSKFGEHEDDLPNVFKINERSSFEIPTQHFVEQNLLLETRNRGKGTYQITGVMFEDDEARKQAFGSAAALELKRYKPGYNLKRTLVFYEMDPQATGKFPWKIQSYINSETLAGGIPKSSIIQQLESMIMVYTIEKRIIAPPPPPELNHPPEVEGKPNVVLTPSVIVVSEPRDLEENLFSLQDKAREMNLRIKFPDITFDYDFSIDNAPLITRITVMVALPPAEFLKQIYEMGVPSEQHRYTLWRQRDQTKDEEPLMLYFDNELTKQIFLNFQRKTIKLEDGYELIVGMTLDLPTYTNKSAQKREFEISCRLVERSLRRPKLVKYGNVNPDVNHRGEHLWPPCIITRKIEPFVGGNPLPPPPPFNFGETIQGEINRVIKQRYGSIFLPIIEREERRELTLDEKTYNFKVDIHHDRPATSSLEAPIEFDGVAYKFPDSNTFCYLDWPKGKENVVATEKGSSQMIAKKRC